MTVDWPAVLADLLRTGRLFTGGPPARALAIAAGTGAWWVVRMYE